MKVVIQIGIIILINFSCNSRTERLESHFHDNKALYKQLRTYLAIHQTGGKLINVTSSDGRLIELLDKIPLQALYVWTDFQRCDSTSELELEIIFERNIQLNYSLCQPKNENELRKQFEIIPLTDNWVIIREKDFI